MTFSRPRMSTRIHPAMIIPLPVRCGSICEPSRARKITVAALRGRGDRAAPDTAVRLRVWTVLALQIYRFKSTLLPLCIAPGLLS
jgi:hypothetical protein